MKYYTKIITEMKAKENLIKEEKRISKQFRKKAHLLKEAIGPINPYAFGIKSLLKLRGEILRECERINPKDYGDDYYHLIELESRLTSVDLCLEALKQLKKVSE